MQSAYFHFEHPHITVNILSNVESIFQCKKSQHFDPSLAWHLLWTLAEYFTFDQRSINVDAVWAY